MASGIERSTPILTIDGSFGKGGGQILRTALGLSMGTGRPFRINKIRERRDRPGLRPQHLPAVNAAATVCGAEISGAELGSQQLVFRPARVVPGEYTFSVGTAGSCMLVLRTVLPPLVIADSPSRNTLRPTSRSSANSWRCRSGRFPGKTTGSLVEVGP